MRQKIGIGLITCNAVEKLKQSSITVPSLEHFVIVNDGIPYDHSVYPKEAHVIQHDKNYSVAKSKNDAINYLLHKGCEHIFIMEDDVLIKNDNVFEKYIKASEVSGILHLNYALQGPNNRKQSRELLFEEKNSWERLVNTAFGKKILLSKEKSLKAEERTKLSEISAPNPRLVYKYNKETSIAFYMHCVGAFSYYRKEVIEKIGLMDEKFINAWEHIDHTYKIIKEGFHPPFWWFADLADSELYLDNILNCMDNSTIAKSEGWKKNIINGEEYFIEKNGIKPINIPNLKKNIVLQNIKHLRKKYALNA